jgi:exodeoxyribonuclease V beta subunit
VLTLGADVGNALHGFFEHVDFQDPGEDADVQALVARQLRLVGQKLPGNPAAVTQALRSALSTPFCGGEPTLALSAILKDHRLDEMTFDMAVALPTSEQEHGSAVSAKALAAVFRQHATSDAVGAYADRVQTLPFAAVRGYLTGAVDLIFRWDHSGRWYVVDYKTNYLGDDWSHYAPATLSVTMSESHYMLQYHLYCVALHRHLRRVLVDYDYERDFGGVYYLFVRGMRQDGPAGFGVYADRPSAALVDALDDLLRLGSGGASS